MFPSPSKRLSKGFFVLMMSLFLLGCSKQTAPPTEPAGSTGETPPISAATKNIEAGQWILNTESSLVNWSAARIVGNSHTGTVGIQEGILNVGSQGINGGSFTIDMTTITESNDNERFLGHVRSEDFFDVENYPASEFFITQVEPGLGGTYEVTGDLTIKDQTNPITFTATTMGDGNVLSAQANFSIDRTQWGITYDSGTFFTELADKAIRDEINFDLSLVFELPVK